MTIQQILKDLSITKYTIHKDGSVTAYQSVNISNKKLVKIPINFREIEGHFDCSHNHLTNLVGAPQIVKGYFHIIKGYFHCSYNYLTSLEGAPQEVTDFYCHHNQLISLDGLPLISGDIICDAYLYEDINYQRHYLKQQIRNIK